MGSMFLRRLNGVYDDTFSRQLIQFLFKYNIALNLYTSDGPKQILPVLLRLTQQSFNSVGTCSHVDADQ